jgi:hypothetical protein
MRLKSTIQVLVLIFLSTVPARTQQNDCRKRTVPVNIVTRDGSLLPEFSAPDFQASVRGNFILRVPEIALDEQPRRIILLLDGSPSITYGGKSDWNLILDVASRFLQHMPSSTTIGLAVFSVRVETILAPTAERQKLLDAVQTLRKSSDKELRKKLGVRTSLWDTISAGLTMLGNPQLGDAIYVITDGLDNMSMAKLGDVEIMLGAAGVRLFSSVLFGRAATLLSDGPTGVVRIAANTGGWVFAFPKTDLVDPRPLLKSRASDALEMRLDLLCQRILTFYRMDIELRQPVMRPLKWKLDLNLVDKSQQRNLMFAYPQELMPCN